MTQPNNWTLNYEMDSNAKDHFQKRQREKAGQEQAIQMSIAGEPWQFTIQGLKISCNFKGAIKEQTHGHWEQKKRFNDGTADDVEWQATEDTVKSMQQHRQHWLNKHTSNRENDGQKKRMHICKMPTMRL